MIAPSQTETAGQPDGVQELDTDAQLAIWRGITIHKLLEVLSASGNYPATTDSIKQPLQILISETRRDHPEYLPQVENCLDEALANYNEPDLSAIFRPADDARHILEMPVLYTDEQGVVVKGYMDHVIKRTGEVTIIDYKSHRVLDQHNLKERVKPFEPQLEYYRRGARKLWPSDRIKTGILFTHTRQLVWVHTS
jgi:ATP-dependent exoDNAse (exonuclease V) beta subunit